MVPIFRKSVSHCLLFSLVAAFLLFFLSGCIGTVIDVTSDAAIATAKVPFKAGKAVAGTVVGGDKDKEKDNKKDNKKKKK